jgi:pimeloyl-[acyl-carrier protein] methyl ester esterase
VSTRVEIRGEGPDLVLLHGWALHGGMWGPWLDQLQKIARLHILDLPGHGHSSWPAGVHGLGDLARAVLPHVPRGAAVLGWSLGGMIALELARQAPRLVSSLVLVASTPKFVCGDGWEHGMRRDALDEFARGLTVDYRRTVHSFLALQAQGDERSAQALRLLRRRLDSHGPPDPRALESGLSILRTSDLRDILPGILLPALVISGSHDRLTPPEAGQALAAALPQARFHRIERCGHAPFLSHDTEVLGEVRAFLARRGAPLPAPGAPA